MHLVLVMIHTLISEKYKLSDRFDRERGRGERIGLPAHSTLLRNRDRDSAPHLLSGTTL